MFLSEDSPVLSHIATDWLASCWLTFWGSLMWFFGSILLLVSAENDRQVFVWATSLGDAFLVLVVSVIM